MGRPRKVQVEPEIVIPERPKPQIYDPNFGYPRPAPKPSQMKKGRKTQEESDE